jgi:vanadium chloroperoxidase
MTTAAAIDRLVHHAVSVLLTIGGEKVMPDPILLWNEVALEANRVSHTNGQGEQAGPPLSARALAIVHLAMYDAYAGVINDSTNLPRYIANPPSPSISGSKDEAAAAAVTAAAHRTLSKLFPSQAPFFDSILAGAGNTSNPGHGFGTTVADTILDDRKNDPGAGSVTFKSSLKHGKHRPDPDNAGQGFHAPDYGKKSKGFGIEFRHEIAPPPLDNSDYRKALKEVRGRGIAPELMGTLPDDIPRRTAEQTLIGIYWGYDGASELGTPPRLYNQIVRRIATTRSPGSATTPNSVAENARLFAFLNVALTDAGILSWDQKYIHNFWRPIVGIREHDKSMGPKPSQASNAISDEGDPLWLPLGAPNTNRIAKNFTPPFPAYPSGHATFGAAALHITRLFYNQGGKFSNNTLDKDTLFNGLDFVSDEFNGISTDNKGAVRPRHLRAFPEGLWQMIEENGRSRVYLGVHWVFDAFAVKANDKLNLTQKVDGKFIGGVPLGLLVAEDIFKFGHNGKAPKKSPVGPRPEPTIVLEERAETFSSSYQPATPSR